MCECLRRRLRCRLVWFLEKVLKEISPNITRVADALSQRRNKRKEGDEVTSFGSSGFFMVRDSGDHKKNKMLIR